MPYFLKKPKIDCQKSTDRQKRNFPHDSHRAPPCIFVLQLLAILRVNSQAIVVVVSILAESAMASRIVRTLPTKSLATVRILKIVCHKVVSNILQFQM